MLAIGLLAGGLTGCSISLPIGSLIQSDATSSVRRAASPISPVLDVEDWRRARSALAVALDPRGNGESVGWDNPQTRLHGTFVAQMQAYVDDDRLCRRFLSLVATRTGDERRAGTACLADGDWTVIRLGPAPDAA